MNRLIGWFSKDPSKTVDDEHETVSPLATEPATLVDDGTEVTATENVSPLAPEPATQVDDGTEVTATENIKPVLYTEADLSVRARTLKGLQKYTYLQPEDCLFCKCTSTLCASLLYGTGVSAYRSTLPKRDKHSLRAFISYSLLFSMWAVFMHKEWYNAVFRPPGEGPRSFIESEIPRIPEYKKFFTLREELEEEEDEQQKVTETAKDSNTDEH